LTRVNAAAIGQDLVHAAISGKSAIVTASGEITAETGLFEETILYGRVQLRAAGPTLYTRWGDWLVYLAIVGMLFGLLWPGEGGLESVLGRRSRRQ
jgi:apolipoprotein N-acyltransferase